MVVGSTANKDSFQVTTPSEHEIRMTHLFDAPRQLVFEVIEFVGIHVATKHDLTRDHELPDFVTQHHELDPRSTGAVIDMRRGWYQLDFPTQS